VVFPFSVGRVTSRGGHGYQERRRRKEEEEEEEKDAPLRKPGKERTFPIDGQSLTVRGSRLVVPAAVPAAVPVAFAIS
jgi:hypothetical protein